MRRLAKAVAAMLLLAGAGFAALWWVYTTESGLRFVAAAASKISPSFALRDAVGSVRDGFTASQLAMRGPTWSLQATDVLVDPYELRWYRRSFDFERVSAHTVAVDWVPEDKAAVPPVSLALPVGLRVRELTIGTLQFGKRGSAPRVLSSIAGALHLNADETVVERGEFQYDATRVTLNGRVDARAPFGIQAQAHVASTLLEHALDARVRASGTLLDAFIEVSAKGRDADLRASARVTPFAPVPLAQLTADIAHFNPAVWFADVPIMRLRGSADLKPVSGARGFSVEGPFSIENLEPGPLDKQLVPIRSARGELAWSADTLTLALRRVDGIRGTAHGALTWSAANGVDAKLSLSEIDASTIHSRVVPTRIGGTLNYALANHAQRFAGTLRNEGASGARAKGAAVASALIDLAVDFNLLLRDQVLDIEKAHLRIADGQAALSGRVELRGGYAARVKGTFDKLDLARLVKGLDTRLNGSINLDGRFRPAIIGRAEVALADSRLMGRPLDGRATIELADQRIDVDVNVTSQSARLTAQGGLGAGRELAFELVAPKLAEIAPQVSGSVNARGSLSGDYASPLLKLDATAASLEFPGQRIASATASIAAGAAPTAPLAAIVKLTGHRGPNPATSLESATLIARGTSEDHSIELNGTTMTRQPLRLIASGGWIANAGQPGAWRGSLVAAETGRPLDLRLRESAPLTVSLGAFSLGPARFEARGAQFSAVEVRLSDRRWRTSGIFDGLTPQVLDPAASAPRRVVRTDAGNRPPLTLSGRWALELTETLTGIAIVERTSGDIYGGVDALSPIGINGLGLALNVLNNRVTGTAYVRGKALGRIDAVIDAYVDSSGGMQLARDRPFRIDIDAVLPDLSWLGPLIGDSVQLEGSGSVKTTISGTPAEPTASGPIRAHNLRVAYVEQGLRLENGTLDANLEDAVLIVNELVFTGSPRVEPDDRRADEAVSFEKPGRLRAVARIALRSLTGSVGIETDRLPILQRRDRWMVVSGEGGITLAPQSATLYAKLRVDGAFIDFTRLRGTRSLPNDVVVVRAEQPTRPETAAVDVTLDVQANLGQRFYIRGAGLEARLAGELEITGRPGQLIGEGIVRTVGGTYQGYGQRLRIQRGILTFQGPVENPALNVLAVRTGLPVDVGVSVGGTAARPSVRLYSDPSMTDVEKLNWLVLGRPPGGDGGQERALLSAAASALLAGQGDSASTNLMRSLGIDEISLRPGQDSSSILPRETVAGTLRSATGTTAASDFVAIGKRLNDDLYLTFEQSISGAATYVALNYQIARRLSLIARAGTSTALDLVYSIAFD